MKYPIGIQTFEELISEGYVYVDKTALVYRMVTEGKVYFLSRPRRFGKSLLISTLESYFLGKKDLFKGLAMEQLEKEWAVHPVLRLSFSSSNFAQPNATEEALRYFLHDYEQRYDLAPASSDLSLRFRGLLRGVHEKTGRKVVVLVDEYDKPWLDVLDMKQASHESDQSSERN